MSEPVDGGSAEQPVGEGLVPLGEVKIAGDQGGGAFMTLGNQIVQILILG